MLIGRKKEIEILNESYKSEYTSFVAVYGRRGIGKTFLVRSLLDEKITFQHEGIFQGNFKEQLFAFASSLKKAGMNDFSMPNNWSEAFVLLKDLIKNSNSKKKVIFLDEVAWMDTPRSDFIMALEYFYNSWAEARKDVMLIICSSVTSWIVKKVLRNRGGLYNRLTNQIYLKPFTLNECEKYCEYEKLALNKKQIIQAYMVIGGVSYYWNYYKKGLSIPQFIDECFFVENAPLSNEFDYLFSSLFRYPKDYIEIVETLSNKKIGLTRQEILKEMNVIDNGAFSDKLEDLINCGLIRRYLPYGKKLRDTIYQLIDPLTIFHLHFGNNKNVDNSFWSNQVNIPTINAWEELAFERVCILHSNCIKRSLGISGVYTSIYPWSCQRDIDNGIYGSQIDMVIERKDDIINLVEIKFNSSPYAISQKYMNDIYRKKEDFVNCTNTKSAIHITFVTLNGLEENSYYKEIQSDISSDELFAE
ncbi:MAG: AAA family ATPase [Clostridiales bacterium]|nr:AAA family ATPase [Clostridiales bacterium]